MVDMKPSVLHTISGRSIGGAEKVVISLAKEMRSRGCRVVVVCRHDSWTARQLTDSGVLVETMSFKGLAGRLYGPRKLQRFIEKHRIDLVHTHMKLDSVPALLTAARLGIPSVCTVHGSTEEPYCSMADAVIAVSEAVKKTVLQMGVPPDRISVVLNGIPVDAFDYVGSAFRKQHGLADGEVLVGAVSRLTPKKGMDVLLRAASFCPSVKLVVAGYGKPKYVQYLRELADKLGIAHRTLFIGPVDNPVAVLGALDVFATSTREEALGIAILEAMASRVPIVATAVGGIPEIVSDGETGLLVPPDNPEAFAGAIDRLISDKKLASHLRDEAFRMVSERHSVSNMADDVEEVYEKVLRNRRTP